MVYVLTLEVRKAQGIISYLNGMQSMKNTKFETVMGETGPSWFGALTAGEEGVRISFKRIFERALSAGLETIMIFEDDVQFHHDFDHLFKELLKDPGCSCFLNSRSGCHPGVLLLGVTSWHRDNLPWMEYEKSLKPGRMCLSHHPKNFGAFAVVLNLQVVPTLMRLMSNTQYPLDWYWSELANLGFVVRTAYPFLSIPDVSHPSAVKNRFGTKTAEELYTLARKRMKQHGWDQAIYINPMNGLEFTVPGNL
jgi:GR25 family glycosyltransferase involved in LPS biosynthesis